MSTLIDLMGSTFIAGIVFLLIFKLNVYSSNQRFASDSELQLQQNAKTLAEILTYDLRKIGYDCDSTAFAVADSNKLVFYADMDRNGSVDVVSYFVDSTSANGTTNPHDKVLCRAVNQDTIKGPSLGLTRIKFSYLNSSGTNTTNFSDICYVRAEMWIETAEMVNGGYPFTYWEMTINPRNI